MTAFCPCPKFLLEAKLKSFGLMLLAEKISIQSNVDAVLWLLVITFMQIYNEKEKARQRPCVCLSFSLCSEFTQ